MTRGHIMDLSQIEGLTEDQVAAITAMHNSETEGLRNKNDQILGEKKTFQQQVEEKAQALEDARKAAVAAEEQKLIANGETEKLKAHYETQLAEQTATAQSLAEKAQNALLQRDKSSVLNSALSMIHDDYKDLAKAQLSNMLEISYNEDNLAITTFKHDGKVIANNIDEFKSWAGEQSQFKVIMKGVNSGGAGTEQSKGGFSSKPHKEYTDKERLEFKRLDPEGFRKAYNL